MADFVFGVLCHFFQILPFRKKFFSSKKNKMHTKIEKLCILWIISSTLLGILHEISALANPKLLYIFFSVEWKAEMEVEKEEQRRNNDSNN